MNIFLLTALLMSIQLNTQPKIIFNKDFESENSFIIHQAIQTSDDGLVLLLSSMQKNYIIKFSADIDSLWTNFISDDRKANYNLISETSEGELLLLGSRIQPYDSSQSSIFTASSLRISTPESRKQQAVFALMSPDGDLILETFIGEAKYGSPCALIPAESGWWVLFYDTGASVHYDMICVGAFPPTLGIVNFNRSGSVFWSEIIELNNRSTVQPYYAVPTFNPICFQSEFSSSRLILGLNKSPGPPFRVDPYSPPHEFYYNGPERFEKMLEKLGRDTLNIELITIDPKARKREVKIITHYEDFCKTGLDAIYQLWYNFWFFSDSVSATSIENRLFRYEDEGHIKRKTNNFIINDWDTSGIMIRRSVVDFKFDYEKYSFFENRQFHRLSNNSFMIAGEIGLEEIRPDGYNRLIYVSNFDRDGLKWFWKYESPPWNFNLYDMFINDSELTLIITGNQWNNYQKNLYKIIKLKI